MMTDISSMALSELSGWLQSLGQPAYRARQIYTWLHKRGAVSFSEMSDLPLALRETLGAQARITALSVEKELHSALDGTVKFLLGLPDGNAVEAVWLEYEHGPSLCISTQVGCRMGCRFCASTLGGLVRSLSAGELLGEVYAAERAMGKPISTLVMMGIGEPLDNFDNVLRFLDMLSDENGRNLSLRHVSLSTCGICERIDELAERRLGLTLSVSLHAADDATRSSLMPINEKYGVARLMTSCKRYFELTGRRISYEYALIAGANDTPAHAEALAKLLRGQGAHINLIPVNPVAERGTRRGTRAQTEAFRARLEALGQNATVRRELGADINGACGQLRRASLDTSSDTHSNGKE